MNEQFAVATQDLEPRLKDLKDQIANLATQEAGNYTLSYLRAASAMIATVLDLDSINYTVADRIIWYVQEASNVCDAPELNFQPTLSLARDILADMPLPYRVVDGAL